MADLVSEVYAKRRIALGTFTSDQTTLVTELITACSSAIRKYCKREFDSQSFDQLYSGAGFRELLLREYPVISIARVATNLRTVLTITNTSTSNQRATVAVTASGLTLVRVASGTVTTNTSVTFSGNATLQAVKIAVDALGAGWSATIPDSSYSLWPSTDLRAIQGALNAKDVDAPLRIHVDETSDYDLDAQAGILFRTTPYEDAAIPPKDVLIWTPGLNNYRVIYTAGYSTVPEAVQEACAEWVAALFWQANRDPALTQEAVPGSFQRSSGLLDTGLLPSVKTLLAPFLKQRV